MSAVFLFRILPLAVLLDHAHFIGQITQISKRCSQFKRYISGVIHNDPMYNLTQKLFLVFAFQMYLLADEKCLKCSPHLISTVMPLGP